VPFLLRALVGALGLWLASRLVRGIWFDGTGPLLLATLLLGFVNAVVRPVLIFLTLPITILTLGLFLLVVNAATFGLVAWLVPGFHVAGFWPALAGAIITGVVGWLGSWWIRE